MDFSPTSPDSYLEREIAQVGLRLACHLNRMANEAFLARG